METILPTGRRTFDKTVTLTTVGRVHPGYFTSLDERIELEIGNIRNVQFGPDSYGLVYNVQENGETLEKTLSGRLLTIFTIYKDARLIPAPEPFVEPEVYNVGLLAKGNRFGKALATYWNVFGKPKIDRSSGLDYSQTFNHKDAWEKAKRDIVSSIWKTDQGKNLTIDLFNKHAISEPKLSSFISKGLE